MTGDAEKVSRQSVILTWSFAKHLDRIRTNYLQTTQLYRLCHIEQLEMTLTPDALLKSKHKRPGFHLHMFSALLELHPHGCRAYRRLTCNGPVKRAKASIQRHLLHLHHVPLWKPSFVNHPLGSHTL